jgi:hypothetical protein
VLGHIQLNFKFFLFDFETLGVKLFNFGRRFQTSLRYTTVILLQHLDFKKSVARRFLGFEGVLGVYLFLKQGDFEEILAILDWLTTDCQFYLF